MDEFENLEEIENFIFFALEKEKESKQWDLYLTLYPNMTKESFISFEKFQGKEKNKKEKNEEKEKARKKQEETLKEVRTILKCKM